MISVRENALRILRGEPCEYIPDVVDAVCAMPMPILQRPEFESDIDAWGVRWVLDEITGGTMYDPDQDQIVDDIEEWQDSVRFPDVASFDWEGCAAQVDHSQDKVFSIVLTMGPLERMEALCSMEECMCNLVTNPDECAELAVAIAENLAETIRYCGKYLKPDFFVLHDDWGTEHSLFMDPDTWEQVIHPAIKIMYDAVKETGAFIVQHSCGKVESLLDTMIEMGAIGWDSNQTCNDLPAILDKYKDGFMYMGMMDARKYMTTQVLDEAEIRAYFREMIELFSKYGRYFPESLMDGLVGEQKKLETWFKEEIIRYNLDKYGYDPSVNQ